MGEVRWDCPHVGCGVKGAAFRTRVSHISQFGLLYLPATCTQCTRGVFFELSKQATGVNAPEDYSGDVFFDYYEVVDTYPQAPRSIVVPEVPDNVASAFAQAEAAFSNGHMTASAAMYRTTIERALKNLAPQGAGTLNQRIRSLQKSEALPDALINLLDAVRFLGNELHEETDPDPEDVSAGRDFVQLFLVYSYDLPKRVELALQRLGKDVVREE